jgi:hypothetical protein
MFKVEFYGRVRAEYAFSGGYTIVKDYVRTQTLRSREMFVPLVHAPGQAQADLSSRKASMSRRIAASRSRSL